MDGFGGSPWTVLEDDDYEVRLATDLIMAAAGSTPLEDDDGVVDGVRLFDFHRLDGDYDGARIVNSGDLAAFFAHYGQSAAHPDFDPAFDRTDDGIVNVYDYLDFKTVYGRRL